MTPLTDDGGVYKMVVKNGVGQLMSPGAICRGRVYCFRSCLKFPLWKLAHSSNMSCGLI